MPPPKLYTTEEVAEIFQVPIDTVRDWRGKGYGPKGQRYGRHVRYPEEEVTAFRDDPEAYQHKRMLETA
jgi:DNA-binding transcriptional MerR regulator